MLLHINQLQLNKSYGPVVIQCDDQAKQQKKVCTLKIRIKKRQQSEM